jgi:hypothetical protein
MKRLTALMTAAALVASPALARQPVPVCDEEVAAAAAAAATAQAAIAPVSGVIDPVKL